MKSITQIILLGVLPVFLLHLPLGAANYVVELGQDIQDKVDLAQDGDVVIVREATFNSQTVDLNRSIRLVREKDTTVKIGGTITIRDLNQTGVLRDFEISGTGGGRVNVTNCVNYGLENLTGLPNGIHVTGSKVIIRGCVSSNVLTITGASEVEVVDCSFSSTLTLSGSSSLYAHNSSFGNLTATADSNVTLVDSNASTTNITGGKTRFYGSKFGNVTFNACDWEGHDCWFAGYLYSNNSHSKLFRSRVEASFRHNHATYEGEDLDCVVHQCFLRDNGYFYGKRTWVGYSLIGHAYPYGKDALEAHFVGNTFRYRLHPHGTSNTTNRLTNLNLYVRNNLFSCAGKWPSDQLSSTSSSFAMIKRLTALQPSLITHVRNQLYSAKCKINFCYADGTDADSIENRQDGNTWSTYKDYTNPYPEKLVKEIKVFIGKSPGTAYEQNTFINNTYSNCNFRVTYPATNTYSSDVLWVRYGSSGYYDKLQSAHIYNNVFDNAGRNDKHIISLEGGTVNGAFIHGNVFRRDASFSSHAINAPKGADRFIGNSPVPAPDICSYNYFQDLSKAVTGGLVSQDNFSGADPGFVNLAEGDYRLRPDSMLLDMGPEEPHFNDRNGTRNDVGLFGGQAYDPNGNFTTLPVVLATEQSTNRISTGDSTPFIIKARAAVATD